MMEVVNRLPLAIQKNKEQSTSSDSDSPSTSKVTAIALWCSGSGVVAALAAQQNCVGCNSKNSKQQSTGRDSNQKQLQNWKQRSGASGDCGHSSKVKILYKQQLTGATATVQAQQYRVTGKLP